MSLLGRSDFGLLIVFSSAKTFWPIQKIEKIQLIDEISYETQLAGRCMTPSISISA